MASIIKTRVPKEKCGYLSLISFAKISAPPVVPPRRNIIPTPTPIETPPKIDAKRGEYI